MFDPGNFTPHYVENLCRALAGLDLQVELITSSPLFEQSGPISPFPVENRFFKIMEGARQGFFRRHATVRRALKLLGYPFGLWRTWRALKLQQPGILHVQWALVPWLDALLIRKLRSQGWRVVYTAHEVVAELEQPFRRWMYRRIYREVDALIVHTPGLAKKLSDDSGDLLREVRVIPEGISTFPLSPNVDQSVARRALGLDPSGPLLLFFGMIKRYKGLECLLRAWPRVKQEFPNARLLIAGEAMVPMRPFHRLIGALKIEDSVVLRAGYVPRSEAQYFFSAADAVVLPYLRISTSSIVPMAYRYGRPVIATSVGGLPEIVRDGETGYLVPPCSEAPLSEAICRGFRDPESLNAMGTRGRQWFETQRAWDAIAKQTSDLYCSVFNSSPTVRLHP
jgi:glycosyltransferase involved in cell wall biosynthesis